MKHINNIESVFIDKDGMGAIRVAADPAEEWNKDDVLYFDATAGLVKKAVASDAAERQAFVGLASSEKLSGEPVGGVALKTRVLARVVTATIDNILGAKVTYNYDAGTGQYSFAVAGADTIGTIVQVQIPQNDHGYIDIISPLAK